LGDQNQKGMSILSSPDRPSAPTPQFSKRTLNGNDAARAFAASQGLDWDGLSPERKIGLLKSCVQNPREAKIDDVSDLAAGERTAKAIGYKHCSVLRPDEIAEFPMRAERLEAVYRASLPFLGKQFDRRAVIDGSDARVAAAKGLIAAGIEAADDVNAITRAYRERGISRRDKHAALVWGEITNSRGTERIAITTTLDEREEWILVAIAAAGAKDRSAALSKDQIDTAIRAFQS